MVQVNGDIIGHDRKPLVEEVELWRHNPVECVQDLIGNPAFKDSMAYSPEQVFEDEGGQNRIYDEMWTGDW